MERPAKRQKLSREPQLSLPSRTIDLNDFQRPPTRRKVAGKVILPRVPDATVTSVVLEVAVNDGSTATQIAVPTVDVALTLGDLGTLIVPAFPFDTAQTTAPSSPSSDGSSERSAAGNPASSTHTTFTSEVISTSANLNATKFSIGNSIVTVTTTNTFHVSYENGTFIPATTTMKSSHTSSNSNDDTDADTRTDSSSSRSSSKYLFNVGTTDTSSMYAAVTPTETGTQNNNDNNNNNSYNNYNNNPPGVAATGTTDGTSSPSSTDTNSDDSPPILSPQQTKMVGGIVGGIAGVAMVLIVLLYVLRWYRTRLKKQGRLPEQLASSHDSRDFGASGLIGCAAPMSQSRAIFFPGSGSRKWRPGSDVTTFTNATSTTACDSERGFQRVSGRKIAPVLTTGGDQFGGSYGVFEKEAGVLVKSTPVNHSTFDTDSAFGFTPPHRPSSRSAPTTPVYPPVFANEDDELRRPSLSSPRAFGLDDLQNAFGRNTSKVDGVAVLHSSPARTPVMQSPNTSTLRLPSQAPVTMDSDIPEMPLPSPGLGVNITNGIGVAIGTGIGERRVPSSGLSSRSRSATSNGRFREGLE